MSHIGSEHKLHNRRVENGPLLRIDLRAHDMEPTTISTRLISAVKDGASKILFAHLQSLVIIDISLA